MLRRLTKRNKYRSERMLHIRCQISRWLEEYETANTAVHREVCLQMVERNLRQYRWYGNKTR